MGKQKLTITVAALIWRLCDAALAAAPGAPGWALAFTGLWPAVLGLALVWTLGSGVEYFWQARALLVGGSGTNAQNGESGDDTENRDAAGRGADPQPRDPRGA